MHFEDFSLFVGFPLEFVQSDARLKLPVIFKTSSLSSLLDPPDMTAVALSLLNPLSVINKSLYGAFH